MSDVGGFVVPPEVAEELEHWKKLGITACRVDYELDPETLSVMSRAVTYFGPKHWCARIKWPMSKGEK